MPRGGPLPPRGSGGTGIEPVVLLSLKLNRVTSPLQPAVDTADAKTNARAIGPSAPHARVRLLLNIDTPLTLRPLTNEMIKRALTDLEWAWACR
jgi:hypothetical protein